MCPSRNGKLRQRGNCDGGLHQGYGEREREREERRIKEEKDRIRD